MKTATTLPLLTLALLAIGGLPSAQAASPSKPNIVFIYADDWGWGDLAIHGHPHLKTPNLDRLAKEGTDFHQFTVGNPVCSPSRTASRCPFCARSMEPRPGLGFQGTCVSIATVSCLADAMRVRQTG